MWEYLFDVDWRHVFIPDTPLLEIIVRGTVTYLAIFILLRCVLKRESGGIGIADVLILVLIADAAQNAMADDYVSVPDGILLVGTILFWAYALEWLGYRFPLIERWVHPPPLCLVEDGRVHRRNMRQELITEEELMSQVRAAGADDLSEVRKAYIEGDGQITVILNETASSNGGTRGNARKPGKAI